MNKPAFYLLGGMALFFLVWSVAFTFSVLADFGWKRATAAVLLLGLASFCINTAKDMKRKQGTI